MGNYFPASAQFTAAGAGSMVFEAGLLDSFAFALIAGSLAHAVQVHAVPFAITFLKSLGKRWAKK